MGGPTAPVASSGIGGGGGPAEVGQTYCLRWNNHQTNLVQILHALHEVGSYVDCTLVVDDEQFQAHRVVLAANSPYFQHILRDVPQDHCSIILPGVKSFEIAALLQYMYTGETTVTKSQEPEILRTAKELQVKGLYDNLMKFNHQTSATPTSSSGAVGGKPLNGSASHQQQHSSSVISTSTHISPSAAISSSCSPPPPPFPSYQPGFSHYPTGQLPAGQMPSTEAPLTPTHAPSHSVPHSGAGESGGGQWPLSPSAAAAAMLNSVYESAADMNPLKRKKLSAISSMLLSGTRDTPILRNVLAQANPADSSQSSPLQIMKGDKTPTHPQQQNPHHAGGMGGGDHSFNGSDYGGDKEPLSPHTDGSFDAESGNSGGKKPEWKRYKQYTRADMMCAIQAVREGMSALQASRKYGLPSRTLYDKVRKLNITTGRGTHRTPKRSPPGAESSSGAPYSPYSAAAAAAAAHNYGGHSHGHGHGHHQPEHLERKSKTGGDHVPAHHGMPPTIPHSAAALLDHAFLQQALENRGGEMAGREALHAMALAAAAHAAANRMSSSPPETDHHSNGHHGMRSPSPERHYQEAMDMEMEKHEQRLIKRERDQDEREDADDEEDQEQEHVEDLSLARKERPESPYSPQPAEGAGVIKHAGSAPTNGKEHEDYQPAGSPLALKRELIGGEEAQARAD
ncbi:broad-complex core protein [Drosophila bipectinata]|uniref:broad-complex core protein n=1 Tax=Drosophila bipectinata TaxID=42026 RepID=UPI001C8A5359|nr:broad-complex core protein [Drosophila bipectinata]